MNALSHCQFNVIESNKAAKKTILILIEALQIWTFKTDMGRAQDPTARIRPLGKTAVAT